MESLSSNLIRRKVDQQPPPLPILPPELIDEIFTWLPVDSLVRFRVLLKSFKILISRPNFVKSHLRSMKALSNTRPNCTERLFRRSINFFTGWDRSINWRFVSYSLYPVSNDPSNGDAKFVAGSLY
ncbi:unnamed protein product [Linum trigynum]|uniref:F-box domain-containing protein n=1 Tax=Linum trigynum TaxID=586398 RepID=A0AAV2EQG4_9ROSI